MSITIIPPVENITGVKSQVAQGIEKMLQNGVVYFGSSGASLSQLAVNPEYDGQMKKSLARIGMSGERSTTSKLKMWMQDKPEVILADSVHIRGWGKETVNEETGMIEGGDTDHVLMIGHTVVLIDSKRWKAHRTYSVNASGAILRQGKTFPGGRVHTKEAYHMWASYLMKPVKIKSIICINPYDQESAFIQWDENLKKQRFRLTNIERLTNDLDYIYERCEKETIVTTLVSQIAVCCIKPYDSYNRVFNKDLIKNFK